MSTLRLPLAAFTCLALAQPALGAGGVAKELAAIEAKQDRCLKKDSSNAGMKDCAADALDGADKLLNTVYKRIVATLKKKPGDEDEAKDLKERLSRLIASETAWIKFRDTDCELQGTSMLGGSGESLVIVGCEYTMTAKRVKDLDELFSDK